MSAHKAYLVGAGQPTLDDLLRVVHGQEVVLDTAASERVKKDSPPPKSFEPEQPRAAAGSLRGQTCLDQAQARAAVFFKLVSLVNGRSKARVAVLQGLEALLNARILPRMPIRDVDQAALTALADALQGFGTAGRAGSAALVPVAQALQAAGIETPGLSSAERAVLEDGQCASGGTGAICVQAGKALLGVAGAVAALSAEALQADVKAFDAEFAESQPHKGAVEVADDLRALLEGSRQVNAKKEGAGALPAVSNVPVVHGAALDALAAAAIAVRAVLATTALPAAKDGAPQQAASPALANALLAVAPAVLRAASLSLQRCAAIVERLTAVAAAEAGGDAAAITDSTAAQQRSLRGVYNLSRNTFEAVQSQVAEVAAQAALGEGPPPSLAVAEAAYATLRVLQQAVQAEALAAVVSLRVQEGVPTEAAAPAAESAAGGKGDKKKDRRNGAGGMVLGKGTSLLRGILERTAAASVCAAVDVGGADTGLEACLLSLSLQGAASVAIRLQVASSAIAAQLDPSGPALAQNMEALAAVVEANAVRRKPKIAKGARDFLPDQMAIREDAFAKIVAVFKRHGAVAIDTPVFELRETLMGKYGEDSKLIYDLADQGGELLSLRYDLTVPFARYVAIHGVTNIKRYHIAKVYRRDQPQMARGRFREFFQCDFDIAGAYAPMVADAEVVKVLVEILSDLELGDFEVKLNHRGLLDAIMEVAGVPAQKFRPICSAIDKLDKEPWEAVRAEMVEDKGLPAAVADRIGQFVVLRGAPREMLAALTAESHALATHPGAAAALAELAVLFDLLDGMGALGPVSFDLSLARGLDYYTGVIYEAVLRGANVGSIAAGGRYDHLVGMFSGKEVPAVGVSIGIERVFAIVEGRLRAQAEAAGGTIRETETEVLVASIGGGMQPRRTRLAAALWAAGVKAEFGFKPNPKMAEQLGYALKAGIPFMALFGEDEVSRGVVKLKDLDAGTEEVVAEAELPAVVRARAAAKGERRIVYQEQGGAGKSSGGGEVRGQV